jgi:hypothetical protein
MYHGLEGCLMYCAVLKPAAISKPNTRRKSAASLDVIALQGAVGKSLRQITAAGKVIDG